MVVSTTLPVVNNGITAEITRELVKYKFIPSIKLAVVKFDNDSTMFATFANSGTLAATELTLICPFAASIVNPEPWKDFINLITFAETLALVKYKLFADSTTLPVYRPNQLLPCI